MEPFGHLWAIGYDTAARAGEVRDEIARLAWSSHGPADLLVLVNMTVVVRHPDGSFSVNREPAHTAANVLVGTLLGLLAGLVLAAPLTGAAVGALLGGVGSAVASAVRIDEGFVRDVEGLMKPGTSVLFVLDDGGDIEVILSAIRGLCGTVLRTNVDLERARLIQSALSANCDRTVRS